MLAGFGRATGELVEPATATSVSSIKAVVVELSGQIDDYNKGSMIKRFTEARKLGAQTIILKINTYGGLVTSGLEISHFLKSQNDLHIIAFIDEKAISAGAMIALACDEIVMEPQSKLGDCAPISLTTGGELQTMGSAERAKMESPILEDFYESAKRNGYDPLLVQSMVSVGRVVHYVQNESGERRFVDAATFDKLTKEGWKPVEGVPDPVDGAGSLLTVGTDLALKLGLAKATEPTPEALASSRQLQILATLAPTSGEEIIGLLSSSVVRGLLTTIFLFALYTSFSHPGHGMAEVLAVTTLCVLVGVPLLTGYAQWWEIMAILIGILLIALEIFVIPGFGITGITGIVLVLFGLTMTWVGNEPVTIPGFLPKLRGTWDALGKGLLVVVTGMFCSLALWFWLQKYLPKLPYLNRLILTATSGGLDVSGVSTSSVLPYIPVGARGKAMTDLRPGGSAAFGDSAIGETRLVDVVSDSGFVRAGADVIVREVQGTRVVVRAVTATTNA
jgi:membrane-bound serine protease (ClpP class)